MYFDAAHEFAKLHGLIFEEARLARLWFGTIWRLCYMVCSSNSISQCQTAGQCSDLPQCEVHFRTPASGEGKCAFDALDWLGSWLRARFVWIWRRSMTRPPREESSKALTTVIWWAAFRQMFFRIVLPALHTSIFIFRATTAAAAGSSNRSKKW